MVTSPPSHYSTSSPLNIALPPSSTLSLSKQPTWNPNLKCCSIKPIFTMTRSVRSYMCNYFAFKYLLSFFSFLSPWHYFSHWCCNLLLLFLCKYFTVFSQYYSRATVPNLHRFFHKIHVFLDQLSHRHHPVSEHHQLFTILHWVLYTLSCLQVLVHHSQDNLLETLLF